MALLGPMVVVAGSSAADLINALGEAGAFPIVEASWGEVPAAVAEIQPVAIVIARQQTTPAARQSRALVECLARRAGPITPMIALVDKDAPAVADALPILSADWPERLIARLRSALRVRTLHATALRRARAGEVKKRVPVPANLLNQATVLCVGRGGSFPVLSVAVGERTGIVGAFSVEAAARYLNARDIDGVVIGDGLGLRNVDALLTVLAEDVRFRELPIALLNNTALEEERLPNLIRAEADPVRLVENVLPYVRLRAFETHLKRTLQSLESEGMIDADTGLLDCHAFWQDLERVVEEAGREGGALSIARFSFEGVTDRRAYVDAARLFARLVRNIDFACREHDGAILAAFTQTDLRSAHVVARRIASVLRHTMVSPGRDRRTIRPTITLATLKATDNLSTFVARVGAYPKVAGTRERA
jgi:GGDEF domain-containing protein